MSSQKTIDNTAALFLVGVILATTLCLRYAGFPIQFPWERAIDTINAVKTKIAAPSS